MSELCVKPDRRPCQETITEYCADFCVQGEQGGMTKPRLAQTVARRTMTKPFRLRPDAGKGLAGEPAADSVVDACVWPVAPSSTHLPHMPEA
eukprot:14854101-Heterocapsa_arctica.AAC.1